MYEAVIGITAPYMEQSMSESIRWDRSIETMEGRPVRVLDRCLRNDLHPIAVVYEVNGVEHLMQLTSDGKVCPNHNCAFVRNVPEKFSVEQWVNVYRDDDGNFCCSAFHKDKSSAGHFHKGTRIACVLVHIEGTVGDGL